MRDIPPPSAATASQNNMLQPLACSVTDQSVRDMAPYAPPSVNIRNDRLHTKGCLVDRQGKIWSTLVSEPEKMLLNGFLCQPLIMTSQMQGFDNKHSRDKFFFNFRDYIARQMRTAFVLGKLSGLKNINKDEHVDAILKSLALLGTYNVYFGTLDTKEHGVPYNHKQCYVVVIRKDSFSYLKPVKYLSIERFLERRAKNAKVGAGALPSTTPKMCTTLRTMKRESSDPLREDSPETVHDNLDRGIYPLTPESRTWQQHGRNKMKIRKIGFCPVPTVATTTHRCAGQTIHLAFVDLNGEFSAYHFRGQLEVWLSRCW